MNKELILLPAIAMVLLTAIVWGRLLAMRIGEMRAKRIRAQLIDTRTARAQLLTDSASTSDNFMNLFEVPVLFYLLTVALYVTDRADWAYLALASIFVGLRWAHSYIHVTYNRVFHRFAAFVASSVVLWIMWGRFTFDILRTMAF